MTTVTKVLLVLLALWALGRCVPKDDTDPAEGRSGMGLYTDHKTGCQYLAKPFGGLIPRIGKDLKHEGCGNV